MTGRARATGKLVEAKTERPSEGQAHRASSRKFVAWTAGIAPTYAALETGLPLAFQALMPPSM